MNALLAAMNWKVGVSSAGFAGLIAEAAQAGYGIPAALLVAFMLRTESALAKIRVELDAMKKG